MGLEAVIKKAYGVLDEKRQREILLKAFMGRVEKKLNDADFFNLEVDGNIVDIRPFIANVVSMMMNFNFGEIVYRLLSEMEPEEIAGLRMNMYFSEDEMKILAIGVTWPVEIYKRYLTLLAMKKSKKAVLYVVANLIEYLGCNAIALRPKDGRTITNKDFNVIVVTWWLSKHNFKVGKEKLIPYVVTLKDTLKETMEYYDKDKAHVWYNFLAGKYTFDEFVDKMNILNGLPGEGIKRDSEAERFVDFLLADIMVKYRKYIGDNEIDDKKALERYVRDLIEYAFDAEKARVKPLLIECYFTEKKVAFDRQKMEQLKRDVQKLEDYKSRAKKEIQSMRKTIEELNKQLENLSAENDKIKAENAKLSELVKKGIEPIKGKYEDIVRSLQNTINDLTNELEVLKKRYENTLEEMDILARKFNCLSNEYNNLKEDYNELVNMKLSSNLVMDFSLPIEIVIERIRDLRIAVIGGAPNMEANLRAMGLDKVKFFAADNMPSINELGICDCIVIVVTYVPHSGLKAIRRYAKRNNIKLVNFNGRNLEEMCRAIHDTVYN